ncbi:MAG: DUF4832 domain-containing protein [Verrucomicrobia bacterium]|nr:DUF4832 domain-containing protein [Verrucomicrobiota bacterium]
MKSLRFILVLFATCLNGIAAEPTNVVVRPADTGEALVNPGMGWVFHFYSNLIENYGSKLEPSDTLDEWPGLSTVFLRVPWSFLEPKEGEYNWSLFDTPAQRWISKGKKIAMRVSCCESWLRYGTPKWVREAGAKGVDFETDKGPTPGGQLFEPDYLDPIFLEKLEKFLAAFAKRYDGNPNVAFLDVGSFGMWGEGHTVFSSRLSREKTLEVAKHHIDLHVKLFPRTRLCISDDFAGHDKRGKHFPITDYALSRGVTLRDDSILVQPPPRSWFHAGMAQAFWPTLPVILEHEHYGLSKRKNAWSGDLLLKSVEDYHASYMSIHWWPRELLAENREAIARINRRLGYRFQLKEIRWPAQARLGEPFAVEATWTNAGVAPCYSGGFWALTLKDEKGGIVSVQVDENFDFRQLPPGPPEKPVAQKLASQFTVAFTHVDHHDTPPTKDYEIAVISAGGDPAHVRTHTPPTKPGVYDVFVSVGQRDGPDSPAVCRAAQVMRRRWYGSRGAVCAALPVTNYNTRMAAPQRAPMPRLHIQNPGVDAPQAAAEVFSIAIAMPIPPPTQSEAMPRL